MTTPCSRIFMKGDATPTWVNAPADVVVSQLEEAIDAGEQFVRFEDVPVDGTPPAAVYVQPHSVSLVMRLAPSVIEAYRADAEDATS